VALVIPDLVIQGINKSRTWKRGKTASIEEENTVLEWSNPKLWALVYPFIKIVKLENLDIYWICFWYCFLIHLNSFCCDAKLILLRRWIRTVMELCCCWWCCFRYCNCDYSYYCVVMIFIVIAFVLLLLWLLLLFLLLLLML